MSVDICTNTSLILATHKFIHKRNLSHTKFQAVIILSHFIFGSRFCILHMKGMSENTSKDVIAKRSNVTGVFRHYSTWTAAEEKATIKDCGLSSSKFTDNATRNAILLHLEKKLHCQPIQNRFRTIVKRISGDCIAL